MMTARFLIALTLVANVVRADDLAAKGRQILVRHQDAVVTLKLVLKMTVSAGGQSSQKSELKTETTGTVIDPSGLILISFTTADPGETARAAIAKAAGGRGRDVPDISIETEVTDLKIVLPDQTEIPGQIVLRDQDLDLAFVRPTEKPAKPLPFVDLATAGKAQVLDDVITINRLNKVADRVPAVSLGRIEAVMNKPRTMYILGQTTWAYALGTPVFTTDEKLIGFIVVRNVKAPLYQDSGFLFDNLSKFGMMPVILPAEDVRDGAKQALEAKLPPPPAPAPEEKKSDAPAPTAPPQ